MRGRLAGRIALVTGASRGIGRAAALSFAKEGAHVIALARTRGGLLELDDEISALGGKASLIPFDLGESDKIDALGPTLYERFGRLDILLANAGLLGVLSPLPHVQANDWQAVFNVNVHANWRLIRTLDPLLKLSDAGRAIFIACAAAREPQAYWGPYAAAKAALEALAKTYAAETVKTSVRVNLVDPGPTRTALRARAFPGEDASHLNAPEAIAPLLIELASAQHSGHGALIEFSRHQPISTTMPS